MLKKERLVGEARGGASGEEVVVRRRKFIASEDVVKVSSACVPEKLVVNFLLLQGRNAREDEGYAPSLPTFGSSMTSSTPSIFLNSSLLAPPLLYTLTLVLNRLIVPLSLTCCTWSVNSFSDGVWSSSAWKAKTMSRVGGEKAVEE
jgi:hypothetical protein